MSHWNFRVLLYPEKLGGGCGIHEVYYDENGYVKHWTERADGCTGNDIEDLRGCYEMMREAFDKPPLNEHDLEVEVLARQMEEALAAAPDQFEKLPDGRWKERAPERPSPGTHSGAAPLSEVSTEQGAQGKEDVKGTGDPADAHTVLIVPTADPNAMFGRRMYNKQTGEEIPFGQYPNIDWS